MLRRNDQHAISVGNLTFKGGLFRQAAFKVLIEHRQIVDADETGVELVSAELGKGAGHSQVIKSRRLLPTMIAIRDFAMPHYLDRK